MLSFYNKNLDVKFKMKFETEDVWVPLKMCGVFKYVQMCFLMLWM